MIYDNHEQCSTRIVSDLYDRKIISIMTVALTQSGKTGTMCSLIKNYVRNTLIPKENIYIITGLSDRDWIDQTKHRMPDCLQDRVYHRNDLLKPEFLEDETNKL